MAIAGTDSLPRQIRGPLRKMTVSLADDGSSVFYRLSCGEVTVPANDLIGSLLTISFFGEIHCLHCGRKTRKSFQQGYCYPCFKSLAQCDACIMSPEKCHYHLGTCREPDWADQFCMNEHIVYLANSSAPKVGITRATQIPTRWIDQGAVQALPIIKVSNRRLAGLVEVACKAYISDRTQWQKMLKEKPAPVDLPKLATDLLNKVAPKLQALREEFGRSHITELGAAAERTVDIHYPVHTAPHKVKAVNLDKTPLFSGKLTGIKGQYLLFGDQVLNVCKFAGYLVDLSITQP